jgi:nucleoside-diphosphate-sugar epimerase
VHLAAIAFPGHADAGAIYRVNVVWNAEPAAGARPSCAAPARRRVAEHRDRVCGRFVDALTEDAPLAPASHYAVSKLAMENMARLFADRLPIVTVRPFNYTGPGQREPYLVPKIVRHFAQRASVVELGNIDFGARLPRRARRGRRVCAAPRTPAAFGQTFNLCSGAGTSVRRLIERLRAITGT